MRAARYHGLRDVRVEEVPEPRSPGPRELLIAPRLCGICGTDLHEYIAGPIVTPAEPHPLTGATLPQILGHELSADVLEVGSEVAAARPGDRVAIMPLVYCGRCYHCRRGRNHLCEVMGCFGLSYAWGGLGERAIVSEYQVAVLPEALSYEQGALIEPTAVAQYGVDAAPVRPGDAVLVTGAGPIGVLTALCAEAAGAAAVYVSEPNPSRARRARELGATEVIDPTALDVVAALQERTGGIGVDVAIECVGKAAALDACVRATRRAGTVVQTGLHTKSAEVDPMLWALNDLTIRGTWCFPVTDWPRIASLIATGRLPVERTLTGRIALEEIVPEGFEALIDPRGEHVKLHVAIGDDTLADPPLVAAGVGAD